MEKIRDFFKNKLSVPMTDEQEKGYISASAKRILKYEKIFLFVIIGIQLYNIAYALYYTNGTLHTVSSRVYTVLYSILLVVSVVCLFFADCLKKKLPQKAQQALNLQMFYGIFLMLWGACITVYDQRVSDNISVYLIISLTIAMIVKLKPLHSIIIFSLFQILLYCFLPMFKESSKDSYGLHVNMTVMTLMCICISIYKYYSDRRYYLYQQIMLEKNSKLNYLANQDSLTGLRNRRFLENEMDSIYKKCEAQKIPLTFMMLDIDSFKNYNDTFGHPQGDECLRRLSWRLNNTLDSNKEYLIRYGGEEFLYIGEGLDVQTAESRGKYFNTIIRELVIGPSNDESMSITVSIGSYTMNWDESVQNMSWEDCINQADTALYRAKKTGKDKCVCYPENRMI